MDTQRLVVVVVIVSFSPISTEEDWQTAMAGARGAEVQRVVVGC